MEDPALDQLRPETVKWFSGRIVSAYDLGMTHARRNLEIHDLTPLEAFRANRDPLEILRVSEWDDIEQWSE